MEKGKDLSIPEAILTNQKFYQLLQKDAQEIIAGEKEKMRQRRLFLPLAYSDFQSLFCTFGAVCLLNRNQNKNFVIDENNEPVIKQLYRKQSVNMFVRKPLIIDEFGRESKTVLDYGNVTRPLSELLSLRSDAGTLTHGTTNFIFNTLSSDEFYGGMIGDRLKTMFNFITLQGESRRI